MSAPAVHQERKFVVARAEEIEDGSRKLVEVNGRSLAVFRVGTEYFGLLNRCPHQGGPLCHGELLGLLESDAPGSYRFDPDTKLVACPWHGWEFDLRTGQSYFDPLRTRARPFPVEVEDGNLIAQVLETEGDDTGVQLQKGPYVAEVFPVSVEDSYLVVTMRI